MGVSGVEGLDDPWVTVESRDSQADRRRFPREWQPDVAESDDRELHVVGVFFVPEL